MAQHRPRTDAAVTASNQRTPRGSTAPAPPAAPPRTASVAARATMPGLVGAPISAAVPVDRPSPADVVPPNATESTEPVPTERASTEPASTEPASAAPQLPVGAVDRGGPRRSATEAEARALASAIRLRIMRLCLDRPLTNKEIARRLGVNPATTLHHVRTLVATEFLAPQPERRGPRGAREVPYLATGKSWTLDVYDGHVNGTGRALLDAFLEEVSHLDLDDMDRGCNGDDPSGFSRLGLRLPYADLRELAQRMSDLLNEFAVRPADMERGVPFSVFVALYRDVTRP